MTSHGGRRPTPIRPRPTGRPRRRGWPRCRRRADSRPGAAPMPAGAGRGRPRSEELEAGMRSTSTSSRYSRRPAGPPWTRSRSSGENTVTRTASANSARRRTGCRLTWVRAVPVAGNSASTSTAVGLSRSRPAGSARPAPDRTRTSRDAPRIDRWVASQPTASRTEVFPEPLGPRSTVRPWGSGSTRASVKQRKSVSHRVVMAMRSDGGDIYDTRTGMRRYR
jgi:hypothetical protein